MKNVNLNGDAWRHSRELHQRAVVIDMHSDLPFRMLDENVDISKRRDDGHEDLPRMREGGLDVQFLAIYVAGAYAKNGGLKRALEMIRVVLDTIDQNPGEIALARSPSEVLTLKRAGKIAGVLALEGGHALENSIGALHMMYRLGVRYMTLTHVNTNDLTDSSTDHARWNGLSDLGKEMVREMNKTGMIVDVSHISDKAFWDVLETSVAPIMATHSSARALADMPRNMTDEMIRATAEHGGMVNINFGSAFLQPEWAERSKEVFEAIRDDHDNDINQWDKLWAELNKKSPLPEPVLDDLIAHIDHIVQMVGPEFVGLGSDYDGVDHVPTGVDDVSMLPNITHALLERGYDEQAVTNILGGNVLRVWREVEGA